MNEGEVEIPLPDDVDRRGAELVATFVTFGLPALAEDDPDWLDSDDPSLFSDMLTEVHRSPALTFSYMLNSTRLIVSLLNELAMAHGRDPEELWREIAHRFTAR